MMWLIGSIAMLLVGLTIVVVNVKRLRFERRVTREMQALVDIPPADEPVPEVAELPVAVARYRELAVGAHPLVRTTHMRHGGTFRTSPKARTLQIRGVQLFTADPPGFVWSGRVHVAPGVWIDARDMAVAGEGSMRVLLDDIVPFIDARGPELDQGAALRLLAEMVWFPTALFDTRFVTWSPIDADHARATLRFGDRDVAGVFEFGSDGLPRAMTAERHAGTGELRPWGGVYRDWRTVSGLRVPFECEVTWQLESGPYTYAHWLVESITYDDTTPIALERASDHAWVPGSAEQLDLQ